MSPTLKRMISAFSWTDSYRFLHPNSQVFSHYYGTGSSAGATRIDTAFHWGQLSPTEARYVSVPLSDHFGFIVDVKIPDKNCKILNPKRRPTFKIKPEIARDLAFKNDLREGMIEWNKVRKHCTSVLSWWELCVKPNIRRLAMKRSKQINKIKKERLNLLQLQMTYLTSQIQAGHMAVLGDLKEVQYQICEWYDQEAAKIRQQAKVDNIQVPEKVRIHHHEQHK